VGERKEAERATLFLKGSYSEKREYADTSRGNLGTRNPHRADLGKGKEKKDRLRKKEENGSLRGAVIRTIPLRRTIDINLVVLPAFQKVVLY